jgi:endo-1,4-beta-xylanase
VNVARKSQQLIRGHTCVWHNQLPAWLTNGKWSKDELLSIVETHCSTLVGHYKGYMYVALPFDYHPSSLNITSLFPYSYSWDVANELFDDSGVWRNAPFYGVTGPDFVATALRAAAAADPATRLYINDYNLEYPSAKSSMLAALAKNLTTAGVPLDGIGFQGHLISGSVPPKSTLIQQMELFTSLGLEVAFTELDIRITLPVTAAKLAQQKIDYQTVVSACMAVEGCIGITIWDYTDKYSWIPGVFPGEGAALPWDENLVKKPAYDGIVTALTA